MPIQKQRDSLRCLGSLLALGAALVLGGCGDGQDSSSSAMPSTASASIKQTTTVLPQQPVVAVTPVPKNTTKSTKRGIADNLGGYSMLDLAAVSPGVSWWYNWNLTPTSNLPSDYQAMYGMEFVPMIKTGDFVDADVINWLLAHPSVKFLLVLNEPNRTTQANMTPWQAVAVWSRFENIAAKTGVKLVGPAMTNGNTLHYGDPVYWLDSFYEDFRALYQRDPKIDFLAFHWYDYGLAAALDRMDKYGKQIWVTEFDNFHTGNDGLQIDSLSKALAQQAQMTNILETRSDVYRYAWYTSRLSGNPLFINLLSGPGQLTAMGSQYVTLPW